VARGLRGLLHGGAPTEDDEVGERYLLPTGLRAVEVLPDLIQGVKRAGLAMATRFLTSSRIKKAGEAVRTVSHALGRPRARAAVERLTGNLHDLANACASEAENVRRAATRAVSAGVKKGRAEVARLADEIQRARRVIGQTARRLVGETTLSDRVISLSDLDARPIRRGKPQHPNEFGYKVSIADSVEGFVVSQQVHPGNPNDTHTLRDAVVAANSTRM
jgi:IS5 family transposase